MRQKNKQTKTSLSTRLFDIDGLPVMASLGVVVGIASSVVILLFRMLIEESGEFFSRIYVYDQFESLPVEDRVLFLFTAGFLLWGLSRLFNARHLSTGIAHVINRVHHHQGRLPFKNALFQFWGGIIALVGGFSVGREGPAVQLGAWCSSIVSQWVKLPYNGARTLIGCGAAAAIAASFNTPLAGAIFAMEVIMMEYTVLSAVPVILSAVIGAIAAQTIYGNTIAFDIPPLKIGGLWELFLVVIMGLACGTIAAIYNSLTLWFTRFNHIILPIRILACIFIMLVFSLITPQVMGLGYDTVNAVLLDELSLSLILLLVFTKLVATGACLGLGLPGGLIGPTLFIGVLIGSAFGIVGRDIFGSDTPAAFFAVMGMVAVLGSVLNAPLAALVTLLELTLNPHILMPGMLAVVLAGITTKSVFGYKSLALELLDKQGFTFDENPINIALHKVVVTKIMRKSFVLLSSNSTYQKMKNALIDNPIWILVIDETSQPQALMPAADLARYIESNQVSDSSSVNTRNENILSEQELSESEALKMEAPGDAQIIDLANIPGERLDIKVISSRATLLEATELLNKKGIGALCVTEKNLKKVDRILGVLTSENLRHFYRL